MHARPTALVLASLLLGLVACSKGDPGANAKEALAQADKPLDGKAAKKASQLEGRWVRVGEAEFDALEFMEGGKVIVGGASGGLSLEFTVLDGGRLSLGAQGGMVSIYDTKLSGDQLELHSEGNALSDAGTSRYRRLGKDETVQAALAAQAKAVAELFNKRVEDLQRFLAGPDLVLAFTDAGPSGPGSIALEIQVSGQSFQGRAWHDDRPPHLNAISGQVLVDPSSRTAQVRVTYGPRIAPPTTQPDGGGQITLGVDGEGKSMKISAQVTVGGGAAHELVLRSDKKLHADIVAAYEAELARIEKLKQPMVDLLGDLARLSGRQQPANQQSPVPDTVELTLTRDAQSGQYWAEGLYVGARERGEVLANAAAEIAVVADVPVLRLVTPPARQYVLSITAPGKRTLLGQWMPLGTNQGRGAELDVVETLDASKRDARFASRREALRAIPADSVFTGLAFEDSASGVEMPIPCRLQISVASDGTVSGHADYPVQQTRMTVTGRIDETHSGPCLTLAYSAAESTPGDKIFLRSIQGGSWHLEPVDGPGPMRLTGWFSGPPARKVSLTLVDTASKTALRRALADTLGSGTRLHVARFIGWQTPGVAPTVVEWSFDDKSGELAGRTIADGRALGTNENLAAVHTGRLEEQDGWLVLKVIQTAPWRGSRTFAALRLYVAQDTRGTLHLAGATKAFPNVPDDQPLPPFPDALDRPIDLVPVASEDAQTQSTIAQAIAAVEKAKADAEAAAEAQRAAATDARRAQMEPFFALFTPSGLVVTTGQPDAMGLVLTDARVDAAAATITGNGIDLGELPLRPFTFECGTDRWNNLTLTTSHAKTAYAFAAPKDGKTAAGRGMALTALSPADRARLDERIALCQRLQSAPQATLTVETLDAATAKTREATLNAVTMPGVAIYRNARNDKVAAMFTATSNGRYAWKNEPVLFRLDQPMKGSALYVKGYGPTDNLVVVVNGVHRAAIPTIDKLGAAIVHLPPDLELLDLRLQADGSAQARAVVLLP